MKINFGKLLDSVAKTVKNNPAALLIVAGIVAPKAAAKVVATVAKVKAAKELL